MSPKKKRILNRDVEKSHPKDFKGNIDDYDETLKLAKKLLRILGIRMLVEDSKPAELFWNILFWFNFLNVCVASVLELINMGLMASEGTFFDLFTMLPCTGYLVVALSKAYKMKRYQHIFENLITEPRSMWPTDTITDEEYITTKEALVRIKFSNKVYFMSNFVLCSVSVLPTFIAYGKKLAGSDEELLLPFSYWLPFDVQKNNRFEITFLVQTYQSFFAVGCMTVGDLLFCIFLNHITTQFHLLALRIRMLYYVPTDDQLIESYPLGERSLMKENEGFNNAERETVLHKEFVAIVQRHQALVRLSNDVENLYTFSLLVNFINSSVIICFCLFCCAVIEKWNEVMYKLFLVTAVMQIWLLCWYGQRLIDTSMAVGEAMYNCGWYMAERGMKKSMMIMIQRSQKPVRITTYGFSVISLENFATIMKTSWSYFTLLINMYEG